MDHPITQWLGEHFKDAIILALGVLLAFWRFGGKIKGWIGSYLGIQDRIQDSQTRLAAGYKDERDEANHKLERLTAVTTDCRKRILELQADLDIRSDISAQDRAYIRALERICTENEIDFTHLKVLIKEQYVTRKTWE